jgi:DNA integrity scanning protein DisA with diadenylate cyclase activity
MLFHFGNCKQDNTILQLQVTELQKRTRELDCLVLTLTSEIQESKAILEYHMHEKEREIQTLKDIIKTLENKPLVQAAQLPKKGQHGPKA